MDQDKLEIIKEHLKLSFETENWTNNNPFQPKDLIEYNKIRTAAEMEPLYC